MDESRKAFELWCRRTRPCLTTLKNCDGNTYSYDKTQTAWKAWKSSRADIEIDLSETFSPYDSGEMAMWIEEVEKAIRAAGIKVKE